MDDFNENISKQEVYLLIAKFLETSPCKNTLKVLKEELTQHKIIPERLDWEGDYHSQSFKEWVSKYEHIKPNTLLDVLLRVSPLLNKEVPPTAPGVRSLLGSGNQSLLRTSKDEWRKHWRVSDYAVRKHQISLHNSLRSDIHNSVRVLHGRELSGPLSKHQILNRQIFAKEQLLVRTLGHLSSVYCVLFDRTGKYIITGADDFLVKIWSSVDGRLLCSLRGVTSEITDITVNVKNTLLAAGSQDKLIKVWCLQTGSPVATLHAQSGVITGVYFCPLVVNDSYYLVATSSNGSVSFWNYDEESGGEYQFSDRPILYNEKMRPGQAQIICGGFSSGGMFLAAGSADHNVRVYCMSGEFPHRIMEMEKHSDRVDSIAWAHNSLRFATGSKDGTVIIWQFLAQKWKTHQLHMSTTLVKEKPEENQEPKMKAAVFLNWTCDDSRLVASINDFTIKVWHSITGKLLHILKGHTKEAYVLECHPTNPSVLFTAGHDGVIFFWDITTGNHVTKYENSILGQDNGSIFDAKWSPDGTMVAATDSHGHLLIFGLSLYCNRMKQLPQELFFHTDYRPIVTGADNNIVLDAQTQIPPHLMPPPFLVDIDGNPYPPWFQRLVPGRAQCTSQQLIPNVFFNDQGQREVMDQPNQRANRAPIDPVIFRMPDEEHRRRNDEGMEGVRNISGNWQSDDFTWTPSAIIPPLTPQAMKAALNRINLLGEVELKEFTREMNREPVKEDEPSTVIQPKVRKKRIHAYRTRATWEHRRSQDDEESSSISDKETSDATAHSVDMSAASSSDSESSEYSDWVADHGVSLEPPQRSRRRRKKQPPQTTPPIPKTVSKRRVQKQLPVDDSPQSDLNSEPEEDVRPVKVLPPQPRKPIEIPEVYRPSEWLAESIPKKFPYYPQMGDEVLFFKKGYQMYLNAVRDKKVYELARSQFHPWGKLSLKEPELVKVIGIKYELRPPRICCLRLAIMKSNRKLTGERFTLKYQDIPDVIDFFVLKQTYDTAINREWKIGDRFRSMIDDHWWWGVIEGRRPHSDSHFLCHRIRWDNGEAEDMSPWDMEPLDSDREPESGGSVPVLREEIAATLYRPRSDEWTGGDRESACRRILTGLDQVMSLAIAEPFNAPVDINMYPMYAYIVEYPIDLSLIKARFENRFYRRLTAAQFDVRYLATNTEKFNEPHSQIVKQARIITDICLKIMKEDCTIDVPVVYRQLLDTYQSSDSESELDQPSTSSKSNHASAKRFARAMKRADRDGSPDWRRDCKQLLDLLWNCKNSEPFREPVDTLKYPDYDKVIRTPLDLSTIREELRGGNYESPMEFCKDIRIMFNNSKLYNTNKKSKIYAMTMGLQSKAEEHLKKIIQHWRTVCKRQNLRGRKKKKKAGESSEPDDDSDDDYTTTPPKPKTKKTARTKTGQKVTIRLPKYIVDAHANHSEDNNSCEDNQGSSDEEVSEKEEEDKSEEDKSEEDNYEDDIYLPSSSKGPPRRRRRVIVKYNHDKTFSDESEGEETRRDADSVLDRRKNDYRKIVNGKKSSASESDAGENTRSSISSRLRRTTKLVTDESTNSIGNEDSSNSGLGLGTRRRGLRGIANNTAADSSKTVDNNSENNVSNSDEDSDDDGSLKTVTQDESSSSEDELPKGIYNDKGTVRILRPVRRSTPHCPEVEEISREVVLEDESSDTNVESELPNDSYLGESNGVNSTLEGSEDNASSYEPQPPAQSSRGRPLKRNRISTSGSDTGPTTSRGRRRNAGNTAKRKAPDKPRPQRSYRKQYRESSESSGEPAVSISSHGRIRRIRPQVRAFLKDL